MNFFSESAPPASGGAGDTLATMQTAAGETALDFTSIPAGATRVTICFAGVDLSGSDNLLIQIGDSGGIETTGYAGSSVGTSSGGSAGLNSTSGFPIYCTGTAATGIIHLRLMDAATNLWSASGVVSADGASICSMAAGRKALSGTLDRVRITRTGSDTISSGQVTVSYG